MYRFENHLGETISLTIDGKKCQGKYGQTILEIARANDIYIPTMCYLPKTSPITSCRMCIVDIQGVNGHILSCQERAVNDTIVTTNNKELYKQRQNIMKLYDVNHPLQCGVCDKSGECDLQNKTLEFQINSQSFSTKDINRKSKKWGILGYDPSLCIMCEKCVSTCNEVIGASSLYIKPGGYKSTIDNKMGKCEQCGDCISVCPVGALVSNDFKYKTNAWETQKIPATCSHCSRCCALYYETKNNKITRVTNNYEFTSLCGAGRFAFSFENKSQEKDKKSLQKAIDAIKKCDTIKFNSYITNEEAKLLQILKEKLDIKLVNEDAYNYQKFLNTYSKFSGDSLYSGSTKTIIHSDCIVLIGSRISIDNPGVKYAINRASKRQKAQFIYMHPIDDNVLHDKYTQFIKYEAGSEEGVMALLASYLIENIPTNYKKYFDNLDIGNLSGETSVGEEELELLLKNNKNSKNKTLIIGEDLYAHSRATNIAKLVGLIDKYTEFNIILVPSSTNTLGVSLICDLDKEVGKNIVGYNEIGDFIISSNEKGDFFIPALNQQEGTFTNINKKVVNTNAALPFNGYCLNDIINEFLDIKVENTIDYTAKLPQDKGFLNILFDNLENGYNNHGKDLRGYYLKDFKTDSKDLQIDNIADINTYNGTVIYRCEPLHQFNQNTNLSLITKTNDALIGSQSFATVAKIKSGDMVNIIYKDTTLIKKFKIDKQIKGTIALCPTYSDGYTNNSILQNYRFMQVQIKKVE
jgi:NADH-quinone oxidoreductase subunit G